MCSKGKGEGAVTRRRGREGEGEGGRKRKRGPIKPSMLLKHTYTLAPRDKSVNSGTITQTNMRTKYKTSQLPGVNTTMGHTTR